MALIAANVVVERSQFRPSVSTFAADSGGTALLGPNGSGKTTLLLALQGLLPAAGIFERTGRCAGVFAQPAVLRGPVWWNVAIVARAALGLPAAAALERAHVILAAVGLEEASGLDARRLSTGQRQRLALARALVLEPQTLFLDEPFANVDAEGRAALRDVVGRFIVRTGCTLVLATQNLADVARLCGTVVLIDRGQIAATLSTGAIDTSTHSYLRALVAEARMHSTSRSATGSAPADRAIIDPM